MVSTKLYHLPEMNDAATVESYERLVQRKTKGTGVELFYKLTTWMKKKLIPVPSNLQSFFVLATLLFATTIGTIAN